MQHCYTIKCRENEIAHICTNILLNVGHIIKIDNSKFIVRNLMIDVDGSVTLYVLKEHDVIHG